MLEVKSIKVRAPLTPIGVQTFADANDRKRLTGTALKAYCALCEKWKLTGAEAAALLGVSEATWDRLKNGRSQQPLSQDQLTRASAAIGLHKGLRLLFADEMAFRWPKLANKAPLFQNQSPVDAMIRGGIPVMLETRRLVDAVRGGL